MKIPIVYIILIAVLMIFQSCSKDETHPASKYDLELSVPDTSEEHPKKAEFDLVIEEAISKGIVGTSVMVKDSDGIWLGAGGSADLASEIPMNVGHQFLIASISKVFTATVVFSLIDEGILSFEDPISKWLDQSVVDQVDNAKEAQIKHLLGHTSGIRDYYTVAFEMARFNREYNEWTPEEILAYTYGLKANFEVGERYNYSNANYVLLGMVIEKAMGKKLKAAYQEKIFNPLNLQNAFFDVGSVSTPSYLVKGYYTLYGNGYVESEFLYKDELGTGDGGVAINAQDLGVFMDALMHGELVSEESLNQMQDWFDIQGGGKNGYGLEYFEHDVGISYGHTGGVDGFSAFVDYFPEQDVTIAVLLNFSMGSEAHFNATLDFLDAIYEIATQ